MLTLETSVSESRIFYKVVSTFLQRSVSLFDRRIKDDPKKVKEKDMDENARAGKNGKNYVCNYMNF